MEGVARFAVSSPANRIRPSTRSACATIALRSDDLPAPLAPMIEIISPRPTAVLVVPQLRRASSLGEQANQLLEAP
jgi:hypothetical protein